MNALAKFSALTAIAVFSTALAHADTVTVNATDVIYAAGTQSSLAAGVGGTTPLLITLPSGTTSFTFSVTGTIILNNGTGNNSNNADGFGAAVGSSSNTGSGSISGIKAPNAGYLTGVFLAAGGPTGSAPASLDFTTGTGTAFTSLSPLIDQVFFIGDGLTGNGTGSTQIFDVPTGATQLYLGISDACGYNGAPSCYGDNLNAFTVTYDANGATSPVPEPSSLLLLGTGLGALSQLALRRRRTV